MKNGLALVTVLFLILACPILNHATDAFPKPRGLINDFANVISPQYEQKLAQVTGELLRKTDVPVVRFRSKDAERVTLPVRNGHFMMAQCSRDGEFYRLSAPPKPDDANAIDTWYDYRGGDKKVAYTIEIFETRDPVGHHEVLPSRESGGYKVLWKKTFVVSVLSGR